jgi:hypothetical protein
MNKRYRILILIIFLKLSFISQVIESSGSGNWNDGSSWNGGIVPTNSDTITIKSGHTLLIQNNKDIFYLKIETGAILNLNPNIEINFTHSSSNISLVTHLENNGILATTSGKSKIINPGKLFLYGNGTFSSGVEFENNYRIYIVYNSNIIINNTYTGNSSSQLQIISGSKITLNAESIFNSTSVILNSGTLELTNENFCSTISSGNPSTYVLRNAEDSKVIYNYTGSLKLPYYGFIIGSFFAHFDDVEIKGDLNLNDNMDVYGKLTVDGNLIQTVENKILKFVGISQKTFNGSGTATLKRLCSSASSGLLLECSNINIEELLYNENSSLITNSSSNLIFKSDANHTAGMLKVGSSSEFSGNITMERYYSIDNTSFGGWVNITSPIENTSLSGLASGANISLCGDFLGADVSHFLCGNFTSLFFYDETSALGTFGNGWKSASDITPTYDASLALNIDNAPFIWSGPNSNKISINGSPELDNFTSSLNVTKTGGSSTEDGWNLISNPYPCSIDWDDFRARNTSLSSVAYSYSPSNTQWSSISPGSSIPHFQSVFVQTNTSTTVDFNLADLSTVYDATYARSSNGINSPLVIKLNGNVNNYTDEIYLNSGANFTEGFDFGFDVGKILTPNPGYAPNIYFLDSSSNKLCHNYINNNQSIIIPIETKTGTYSPGNYTLSFENLPEFMIGSCMTLEDLHNGIITDLRLDSTYTFISDSSIVVSPRFNLNINVAYDIDVTNSTCFDDSSASIKLSGNNITGSYFNLFNSSGLVIDSIVAVSDTIICNNLTSGLYNFATNGFSNCSIENQNIIITSPEEILADFLYSNDTSYVDSLGSGEVFFNNQSQASNYYLWDFGNGTTSILKNTSQVFSPGTYDITLIASNDSLFICNSTVIKTIVVLDSSSLILNENLKSGLNFKILNKNLILSFDKILNSNNNYIDIFDISGKLILSKSFQAINNRIEVPLSKISNGVYIFKIFGESFKFLLN